jgi:hypothetical protein
MTERAAGTREATEATQAGRFGHAAARGLGEIAVLAPAIKAVGLVPTMAGTGAVHAAPGEEAKGAARGAATAFLGPLLSRWMAPGATGFRRVLAEGLGWTGASAATGPQSAEEAVQNFVIGVGQDVLTRHPGASEREARQLLKAELLKRRELNAQVRVKVAADIDAIDARNAEQRTARQADQQQAADLGAEMRGRIPTDAYRTPDEPAMIEDAGAWFEWKVNQAYRARGESEPYPARPVVRVQETQGLPAGETRPAIGPGGTPKVVRAEATARSLAGEADLPAGKTAPALPEAAGGPLTPPAPADPVPFRAAVEAFRAGHKGLVAVLKARSSFDGIPVNDLLTLAQQAGVPMKGVKGRGEVVRRLTEAAKERAGRPTEQEAADIIGRAIQEGITTPEESFSPERVEVYRAALEAGGTPEQAAEILRNTPPETRADGTIAAGYDPAAREKGLIEPGAIEAYDAAVEQGIQPVTSGTTPEGTGYAIGRDKQGRVRRIERAAKPKTLSQFVRSQGGINAGEYLRGEREGLGRNGSGSTGLLRRDGRGQEIERMQQSAKEAGYDVAHLTPDEFIDRVLTDATGGERVLSGQDGGVDAEVAAMEQSHLADLGRWFEEQGGAAGTLKSRGTAPIKKARPTAEGGAAVPTQPKASGPKPKRLTGEEGALRLPGSEDVKRAGQRIGRGLYETLDYAKNLGRRAAGPAGQLTADRGSEAGEKIARAEVLADVQTRRYSAEIAGAANKAKAAAQGGGLLDKAKTEANETAQKPIADSFNSNLRGWVEGGAEPQTPAQKAIKDTLDALLETTWLAQVRRKFTRSIGDADVPMTAANRPKNVLPYASNELGREIRSTGEGHAQWDAWVDAHAAVNPKMSRADVEKRLAQESADEKAGRIFGNEGHMASEFQRTIRRPDFIRDASGEMVPVQIVNPFTYVQHLTGPGARTVGAQMVLGRGGTSIAGRLLNEHAAAVPKGGAKDAETALRAIYGMHPSPAFQNEVLNPPIGSTPDSASRGYDILGGLIRAGGRTGAVGYQTPDLFLGNQAVLFGFRNNLLGVYRTLQNFVSNVAGKGDTPQMKEALESGAKTADINDRSRNIHNNALAEALRRFTRGLGAATAQPFDRAQESTAAFASKPFTRRLLEKAGRFGKVERERLLIRLKAFADIPRAAAERFLDGESSPIERQFLVDQIATRGASRATGSNVAPSQRSTFSSSGIARKALAFYRWFENNMTTTGRFFREAGRTFDKPGMAPKLAATAEVTRFMVMKALNGAAANMLASALLPGSRDFDDEWAAMKKDPVYYFVSAAMFNMAGGSLSNFVTQGRIDIRNLLPGRVYRTFVKAPVDALTGDTEAAKNQAKRAFPITRAVR